MELRSIQLFAMRRQIRNYCVICHLTKSAKIDSFITWGARSTVMIVKLKHIHLRMLNYYLIPVEGNKGSGCLTRVYSPRVGGI